MGGRGRVRVRGSGSGSGSGTGSGSGGSGVMAVVVVGVSHAGRVWKLRQIQEQKKIHNFYTLFFSKTHDSIFLWFFGVAKFPELESEA
jgi:hypothetical protein